MPETVDPLVLKQLVPPAALSAESFRELARQAAVESLPAGGTLFRAGEHDRRTYYLLSGEVALQAEGGAEHLVRAGTEAARQPLSNHRPRLHTARARTAIQYLRLDSDLIDIYLTWDQLAGIEVNEISTDQAAESSADWMTRILQSRVFMRIPPANIQRMFMRLEEVRLRAGDTVIRQGAEGDYYFIINRGRCRVARTSASGQQITLAELGPGDAFGEEALLSEAKRNATVTMLTDGALMRLSKADFNELLRAPMQKEVDFEHAREMVRNGALLLDVRLESEHRASSIRGSLNLPIYMLRLKADSLEPAKRYIVYCDTGRRSSAAAYLLTERGFDAYVLKGGLLALHQTRAEALQRPDG
jgi:CRP-like cAMP-binding protein